MRLLIWYGICAFTIFAFVFLTIHYKVKKEIVFKIMAGISLVSELVKMLTHVEANYFTTGELAGYYMTPASLPFHLCSILIFVYFYLALSKNEKNKEIALQFVVPVGLLAGLMGVLFASSGTSFKEVSPYQSFFYHSFVLAFSMYFMITKQIYLGKKEYIRNLIVLVSMLFVAVWVNSILRVNAITDDRFINFMFVAKPPMEGLPILNLDYGWHVYFAHLACVGIFLVTIVHLPYIIMEKKHQK